MKNEYNYFLGIIKVAVDNGFEFDLEDSFLDIYRQAYDDLMDQELRIEFVHTELDGHGSHQFYTFLDEATGLVKECSGEIFDFTTHSDGVFYRIEDNGEFTPVKWYEVPNPGEERRKYIFVFAKELLSDGSIAYLYDYLK